jgi:serine/threonine-protein kinase
LNLTGQPLGRYHILEPLGEGGMATVYKAFDTRLEREVAVKVIRREAFPPNQLERILARFEREAKSLARLNHPNIVKVHDFGDHDGAPYLVMEYLPGGTLKDRLGKPMNWQDAAKILLPVAEALEYAHEQKMVHRDVKPSNILLTGKGAPLLTDFGVAKLLDQEDGQTLTGTGVGVGTPEYMAPEQWTNKTVPQSDIYGLGVVFYEMVSGRKPYQADTPAALLLKQANDPLPRPAQFAPGLPDAVERVLLKALAKRVEDRYASMAEFAAALEKLAQDTPAPVAATAHPAQTPPAAYDQPTRDEPLAPTYKPQSAPQSRRVPAWTWGLGGLVLLAFCVLTVIGLYNLGAASLAPTETRSPTATATFTFTATATRTPTATHTAIPRPTNTPVFGIGSTLPREQDGMLMVYVPAGPFEMGSNEGNISEKPVHTVNLDAFWMDQTEVTNAMYADFLNAMGNQSEGGVTWLDEADEDVRIEKSGSAWQPMGGYGDHPVVEVNWYGAEAYCEWAGGRLPTEAEWEKAARGGLEGKRYPWGDEAPTCQAGARNGVQYSACNGRTVSVGTFQPNGYGLHDMAGNVWEWVADWYDENYYRKSPSSNPTGPASGGSRVLRGGSWDYYSFYIRSAVRYRVTPDYTYYSVGFRCLRSP